jgi:hypothetical protein
VSVEDDQCSGRPSTRKMTEDVAKIKNSSAKTVNEQSISSQTPLGSVMEFAGDLNRKFEHALHCHKVCSQTLDK